MSNKTENRVSQRFHILDERIFSIEIEGVGKFCPSNLSYGGFGIENAIEAFRDDEQNQKYNLTVHLFGKPISAQAMLAYKSTKTMGFAFVHETTDLLIELSKVIDKMRIGSTLEVIPENLRKESYKGNDWTCWHGDGPTDLRVHKNAGKLLEGILSFRIGENYYDLIFSPEKISLRSAIDTTGVAARMTTESKIDPVVFAQALSVLVGFLQDNKNEDFRDILNIALKSLNS